AGRASAALLTGVPENLMLALGLRAVDQPANESTAGVMDRERDVALCGKREREGGAVLGRVRGGTSQRQPGTGEIRNSGRGRHARERALVPVDVLGREFVEAAAGTWIVVLGSGQHGDEIAGAGNESAGGPAIESIAGKIVLRI